jgi:hypothetical protein
MKYYTFERESNNFDDILKDPGIKSSIYTKISWRNHLMIGLYEYGDQKIDKLSSYIVLKYGDDIRTRLTKDYTPIMDVDYIPKGRK